MADAEPLESVQAPPPEEPKPDPAPGDQWLLDKQGRRYVKAVGRRGIVYQRGEETIAEALNRDQRPKDELPPKKRTGKAAPRGPMPDKPSDIDLKAIEEALAQGFRSPAMAAGMFGDAYLANHFTIQGPILARNLVAASEHNPWLRRQIESMATGGNAAITLFSLLGLAGAGLAYFGPPIVYIFNLPVSDNARLMFDMPPRREDSRNGRPPAPPVAAAA